MKRASREDLVRVGLRLPRQLVARLSRYAEKQGVTGSKNPTRPSRSAAMKYLLEWALDQAEG